MVSKPTFNANRIDQPGYWASLQTPEGRLVNRALDGRYPPGSVFKTVTLANALTSKHFFLDSIFKGVDATGPLFVGGSMLGAAANNLPPGVSQVTLLDAYKYSDNIVFAGVGLKLGAKALLDGASRFGFGQSIPFDVATAIGTVTDDPGSLNPYNVAASAFGQASVLATAIANPIARRGNRKRRHYHAAHRGAAGKGAKRRGAGRQSGANLAPGVSIPRWRAR